MYINTTELADQLVSICKTYPRTPAVPQIKLQLDTVFNMGCRTGQDAEAERLKGQLNTLMVKNDALERQLAEVRAQCAQSSRANAVADP